ncbi:MAG: STAS domain-containing protein [bacterium]
MSQISLEPNVGGAILRLSGQFVGGDETDELRTSIKRLAEEGNSKLIIDLSKTTYLNSTALGVLISGHTSFVKNNGKIVLCNVSKSIENIFVITKLTLVFDITETLDEAIKKLA